MRKFEAFTDQVIPIDCFMVARRDGKGFTKLTKTDMDLEKPFDIRFRQALINTIKFLMNSYFQILYAYNENDEISLLFKPKAVNTTLFWRRRQAFIFQRKLVTSGKTLQEAAKELTNMPFRDKTELLAHFGME